MTSNHHAPYDLGYTRTTMAANKVNRHREVEENTKSSLSSELLVIADQHAAVNTFPGLVHTARHTMRAGGTRSP